METCKEVSIKYYDTNGNEQIRCVAPANSDALVHLELMQSHYCKISFTSETPIYIELGDFIETVFGRFEVINTVNPKESDSIGYSFEIQFDAYYRKWKNKTLKYRPNTGSAEANFSLTNNIGTHAEIILDNLKFYAKQNKSFLYDPKYTGEGTDFVVSVDDSVDKVAAKLITYSSSSILDAIANIAETFDCEWWLEGNIIHFGTCENLNEIVDFKYGDNIVSMANSQSQSTYSNRVYAFGAARNLPSDYKEDASADVTKYGVVEKRLMLPTESECSDENKTLLETNGFELQSGCIQVKGLTEDQYVEGVTTNDDIYPRNLIKTSKITSYERTVEDESTTDEDDYITRTFYRVNDLTIVDEDGEKTGDMAFRSSYKLSGKTLHILFQSGSLNGMDFECEFNPDAETEILRDANGDAILKDGKEQINPASQVFEIVGSEDYGRFLPDTDLHPKEGDTFVLYNWDATKLGNTLVTSASNELLTDAIEDLKKSMIDPTTYTCTADSRYSFNDGEGLLFGLGDRVNLDNKGYSKEVRQSRIIGYEFHLDLPFDSAKYYVGEKPSYSRLNSMESQIEELVYNGKSYVNNGSGGNSVYIIKTYDKVSPTDYNVYSAKSVDTQRLNKTKADTAQGHITFADGLTSKGNVDISSSLTVSGDTSLQNVEAKGNAKLGENGTQTTFGKYVADSTGASVKVDSNGTSYIEADYLTIRRAADFREITIRELKHIGGELAITPAAMEVSKVERLDADKNIITDRTIPSFFKCYFEKTGSDGKKKVYQEFIAGDQARCQQFGIQEGTHGYVKTKYYWMLVTEVGTNYIMLSNSVKDEGSTSEPDVNDNIVQLGYRGNTNIPSRQAAIILSAASNDAPSQKYYQGINDFSLDHVVKDEGYNVSSGTFHSNVYGDSFVGDKDGNGYLQYDSKSKTMTFKGTAHFDSDSTVDDDVIATKSDLQNLNIKSGNILRNTSFTGNYESVDISEDTDVSEDTETYSDKLLYWELSGVSVLDSEDVESGKAASISNGYLSQTMTQALLKGGEYTLSFKGKGTTVTIEIGGNTIAQEMGTDMQRYEIHFQCTDNSSLVFKMSGESCTIGEIMLSYGNISPAWSPAYSDNDKSLAEFQSLKFLTDAITEGSTTVDGGLVMSQQFRVGNYRDGKMTKETGGMSGYYNGDNSAFLWGGGTLEQAIYTIQKYKDNPSYQATENEIANMAKFVVTHGGRAILNDIVLRGIIYAEGGKFENGSFHNVTATNISVQGSFKSQFAQMSESELPYNDNIFLQGSNGILNRYKLLWDVSQSGRLLRLCNYSWDGYASSGYAQINAPDGYCFMYYGKEYISLYIAENELVELLGIGDGENFKGWAVVNRTYLYHLLHGQQIPSIAIGRVETNKLSDGTIETSGNVKMFDGSYCTVTRQAQGIYRIAFPSSFVTYFYGHKDELVISLTGLGQSLEKKDSDTGAAIKATVTTITCNSSEAYIEVMTSDNETNNDGSFFIEIKLMSEMRYKS